MPPSSVPHPPAALRQHLERSRATGLTFDGAWAAVLDRQDGGVELGAHGTAAEWRQAFEETRAAWQAAYDSAPAPQLDALARLEAHDADDDAEHRAREAPHVPNPAPRMIASATRQRARTGRAAYEGRDYRQNVANFLP